MNAGTDSELIDRGFHGLCFRAFTGEIIHFHLNCLAQNLSGQCSFSVCLNFKQYVLYGDVAVCVHVGDRLLVVATMMVTIDALVLKKIQAKSESEHR